MRLQSINEFNGFDFDKTISVDMQVEVMFELLYKVLDEGTIKARTVKYKLQKYINSKDVYKRLYALNKIVTNGKGVEITPNSSNALEVLQATSKALSDVVAKRYVQNKIETQVEQYLMEKQDKYVDELRLGILKKQKGPENAKTLKKIC
ncbi:hypothetical protein M918_22075 [Clostridium sp. BL8]|nr:hypothetical protein M918_22075 [Clostridium sp. BL8]